MRKLALLRSNWCFWSAALLVVVGMAGWLGRGELVAWYCVLRLASASTAECAAWAERLAELDSAAEPRLVNCLTREDSQVCANVQAGIAAIYATRTNDDPRRLVLIGRLADDFPRFSLAGQGCALELVADWVPLAGPEGIQATVRMLPLATRSADKEVRGRAVALAGLLAQQPMPAEMLAVCREVVRKGLQDAEPDNRVLAVQQATHAALDLLPQVAPLLDDPVPVVRRSAILAVGPAREAIATDDLLRSLHDTDEDVRRLCEAALKQTRGLSNSDVALGRLISDSRPGTRLQVLDSLRRPDLEPGIWLRQLSHDAVPAVRAAAVRAAGEQQQADLSARLWQMAQNDPSPTVRQLAQFYSGRKKLPPSDSRGP